MAIEVSCSNCGEEFRVKDEAAGKSFKCKVCGTTIRIPEAEDDDDYDEDFPPRRRTRDDDDEDRPKRRKKKSSAAGKTLGPAIGLYVTCGLWLLYSLFNIVIILVNPEAAANAQPPPGADPAAAIGHAVGFYGVLIGFPLITLVILAGAFCLHTRRVYGLALTACILASIPCCSPGCVLGMPFGIWGLVVLNQEDVKRMFQ